MSPNREERKRDKLYSNSNENSLQIFKKEIFNSSGFGKIAFFCENICTRKRSDDWRRKD